MSYQDNQLHMEEVALATIAEALGTPSYVYSKRYLDEAVEQLKSAFAGTPTKIHYSVKANSNLSILRVMAAHGCGFDIVSGGELSRVVAAGCEPGEVIFSGVGKTVEEIDYALKLGIHCFNVESEQELNRISERARNLQKVAAVSMRVNPNVDAQTHPYISTGLRENKFGVSAAVAMQLYQRANEDPHLNPTGIDCHIGSQISQTEPLLEALTGLLTLVDDLERQSIKLEHIDLGGGMGIQYKDEDPLDIESYGGGVAQILGGREQTIFLEPGRSLTANGGVLLTRAEYIKPGAEDAPNFAVVDAAMNDLIRPALYQAWHDVLPLKSAESACAKTWQIVGPVCESGDFLAKDRELPIAQGDLLAVTSAGAYGMVQASNYNSRGRPCEVLVDGDTFSVIRRRETISDQLRLEREQL
ncbi:MAG: diaminopimelate decarboxylase [Pseudomonadales bacterium]|nr:diaminopimelate decarboxylase [Pseudomonadales bacterium]